MMVPWTTSQHVDMHWRPDAITRTGVIQPMWIRQVSPVDMARHTIDPFIASVRGAGPAVSPYPSPEDIAYTAGKLANEFAAGRSAVVCFGTEKIKVKPNTPPSGGIVGTITAAAQKLARGGSVKITVGGRSVVVNRGANGNPVVQSGSSQATTVTTGPTSLPPSSNAEAFGSPLLANTRLPQVPGPGGVPQYPFLDYAYYYRKLNYDDNVWGRRNFQASMAQRFAPAPIAAMNAATKVPIKWAQGQAAPALATRAPMVMQRWPHPEAVWPRRAHSRGAQLGRR